MLVQIHMSHRAQAQYPAFARSFNGIKGTFKRGGGDDIDFNTKEYVTIDIGDTKKAPHHPVWLTVASHWLKPAS